MCSTLLKNFAMLRTIKSCEDVSDGDLYKTETVASLSHSSTNDDICPSLYTLDNKEDFESLCIINLKNCQTPDCYRTNPLTPSENLHLFTRLEVNKEIKIRDLNWKIRKLLHYLDEEIEAISIRDECSIAPKPLELDSPSSNFIKQRRKAKK
ncbi:unnamed protein product [Blepharisma stoltei]|uniref:Uncharacterized protein n=1 Tax=Blepharisma stoltei TaxID=1481888 RepID=A0AAU9JJX6_9CILI|nr:unnamed protein product [Blepharisma stoltei]